MEQRVGEEKNIIKAGDFIIFVKDKDIVNVNTIRCIFWHKETQQVRIKYDGLESNMARLRHVTFDEVVDFLKKHNIKTRRV